MFVFLGVGSLGSSHWELMGDAMVTTEQVRLTPDMQSRQGAVWSRIVSNHNLPTLTWNYTFTERKTEKQVTMI